MTMTIKTGDNVLVITGKDKGNTGKVVKVLSKENKVVVENINIVTKHNKPRSQQDKGGIVKKPAPMEASNVMVVCPGCGKASRVGHEVINGKKVRVCKKCKVALDKEFTKASKKENKKTIKSANELKGATLKQAGSAEKKEVKTEAKKAKVETKEVKTETKKSTSTTKKASK